MYISICLLVNSRVSSVSVVSTLSPPVRSSIIGSGSFIVSSAIISMALSVFVVGTGICFGGFSFIFDRCISML